MAGKVGRTGEYCVGSWCCSKIEDWGIQFYKSVSRYAILWYDGTSRIDSKARSSIPGYPGYLGYSGTRNPAQFRGCRDLPLT
eukprot:1742738-Rhodomonas_salina.4